MQPLLHQVLSCLSLAPLWRWVGERAARGSVDGYRGAARFSTDLGPRVCVALSRHVHIAVHSNTDAVMDYARAETPNDSTLLGRT